MRDQHIRGGTDQLASKEGEGHPVFDREFEMAKAYQDANKNSIAGQGQMSESDRFKADALYWQNKHRSLEAEYEGYRRAITETLGGRSLKLT